MKPPQPVRVRAPDDEATGLPGVRSWRAVYCIVVGTFIVWVVLLPPAHEGVFVNWLDYVVLIATMVGIAAYGIWRTRGQRDLNTYLKGGAPTPGW